MKLVSAVSNPDYVRFSKTLTVEHKGIVVKQEYYGTTFAGRHGGRFIEIDDWEFDVQTFLGEEVNPKGFKEMYNKLFKKGYESFEQEVEEFSKKVLIEKYFPDIIENSSPRYLIDLLEIYEKDAKETPATLGSLGTYNIYKDWEILQIAKELHKQGGAESPPIASHKEVGKDHSVRGVSTEYVSLLIYNFYK